ncbi:MAG: HAD family hydrolase [Candidatus Dormibacterales bacterium]
MIRALVFDFDGLILETEEPIYREWEEIFGEHGQQLPGELYASVLGTGCASASLFEALERLLGDPVEREAITARRRDRERAAIEALRVRPGVISRLSEARAMGLRLAVASSSTHAWVDGHLARLGLGALWDCTVCREDVAPGRAKPAPDLYLRALGELEVGAVQAIAFEDSLHGVAAAKAAGLYCVAVPGPMTSRMDLGGADLKLRSLAEMDLEEVIRRLTVRPPGSPLPQEASGRPPGKSPSKL